MVLRNITKEKALDIELVARKIGAGSSVKFGRTVRKQDE